MTNMDSMFKDVNNLAPLLDKWAKTYTTTPNAIIGALWRTPNGDQIPDGAKVALLEMIRLASLTADGVIRFSRERMAWRARMPNGTLKRHLDTLTKCGAISALNRKTSGHNNPTQYRITAIPLRELVRFAVRENYFFSRQDVKEGLSYVDWDDLFDCHYDIIEQDLLALIDDPELLTWDYVKQMVEARKTGKIHTVTQDALRPSAVLVAEPHGRSPDQVHNTEAVTGIVKEIACEVKVPDHHIQGKYDIWNGEWRMEDAVIRRAVSEAASQGQLKLSYIHGILKRWHAHRVTTVEDIERYNREHEEDKEQWERNRVTKRAALANSQESTRSKPDPNANAARKKKTGPGGRWATLMAWQKEQALDSM